VARVSKQGDLVKHKSASSRRDGLMGKRWGALHRAMFFGRNGEYRMQETVGDSGILNWEGRQVPCRLERRVSPF
jgi:hypothetical protein